eukprot:2054868-Rhodomonas_salina.2
MESGGAGAVGHPSDPEDRAGVHVPAELQPVQSPSCACACWCGRLTRGGWQGEPQVRGAEEGEEEVRGEHHRVHQESVPQRHGHRLLHREEPLRGVCRKAVLCRDQGAAVPRGPRRASAAPQPEPVEQRQDQRDRRHDR